MMEGDEDSSRSDLLTEMINIYLDGFSVIDCIDEEAALDLIGTFTASVATPLPSFGERRASRTTDSTSVPKTGSCSPSRPSRSRTSPRRRCRRPP